MRKRDRPESSSGLEIIDTSARPSFLQVLRQRQSTANFVKVEQRSSSERHKHVVVELNYYNEATKTKTEEVKVTYDFSKDLDANICTVLQTCGYTPRDISQRHGVFTLRDTKYQKDLRQVEEQGKKLEDYIREGTRLELVEYFESSKEANAFRMSFGDCSNKVSFVSERPSDIDNIFLRSPSIAYHDQPIFANSELYVPAPPVQDCKARRGRKAKHAVQEVQGFSKAISAHCRKQAFWNPSVFEPTPHPSMFAFICKHANELLTRKKPRTIETLQRDVVKEMNKVFGVAVHQVSMKEDKLTIRCVDNCPFQAEFRLTQRGLQFRDFASNVHSVEAHADHSKKIQVKPPPTRSRGIPKEALV